MNLKFPLVAALITGLVGPVAAQQQPPCFKRADLVMRLAEQYGEARQGAGLTDNGQAAIEVFANTGTGTWTVVVSRPDGMSCPVATGTNWVSGSNDPARYIPGTDA